MRKLQNPHCMPVFPLRCKRYFLPITPKVPKLSDIQILWPCFSAHLKSHRIGDYCKNTAICSWIIVFFVIFLMITAKTIRQIISIYIIVVRYKSGKVFLIRGVHKAFILMSSRGHIYSY